MRRQVNKVAKTLSETSTRLVTQILKYTIWKIWALIPLPLICKMSALALELAPNNGPCLWDQSQLLNTTWVMWWWMIPRICGSKGTFWQHVLLLTVQANLRLAQLWYSFGMPCFVIDQLCLSLAMLSQSFSGRPAALSCCFSWSFNHIFGAPLLPTSTASMLACSKSCRSLPITQHRDLCWKRSRSCICFR